jgi:ADP-heptose:LPS heptosyltransferase
MPARKTLVIRGGALGDFILTLPVLAALRRHFPDSALEILGYPPIASLALAAGLADEVRPLESPALACLFTPRGAGSAPAVKYFAQFQRIVSYLYDPEEVFQRNVTRESSAQFIAGPHRPDENAATHATEALLQPLQALGIQNADPRPRLNLAASNPFADGAWLAAHPGSGGARKNWPEAKWFELLPRLARETRWNFLLISGEAEGDRGRRLAAHLPPQRVHLAQNLPLAELARKMKSCAAFLGHDSGVTHLAAALDLPGLVLWGPTSPAVWRPRAEKMRLLREEGGLAALPVETVARAVTSLLNGVNG